MHMPDLSTVKSGRNR